MQVKRAEAGGPVQADCTANILNLSWSPEQNLVGHLTRYTSRSSSVSHVLWPRLMFLSVKIYHLNWVQLLYVKIDRSF